MNHLCAIILKLDQGFWRSCYLSQLLTDDDRQRRMTDKDQSQKLT